MKLLDYSCNKWGVGCLEYNQIGAELYPQDQSYQNRVNQFNYLQNAVLDFGGYSVSTAGILETGGGLPTLKAFLAGGTIATTANVSVQMSTNKPDEGIKFGEAANAFVTGGLTFGKGQLYSAAVNGWGAFTTATLQGDNVPVKVSAAVVGSLFGGVVGEKGSQFIANAAIASSIRFESQWLTNSLLNTYSPMKNVVPSYISEGTGVAFDKLNEKMNPPKKMKTKIKEYISGLVLNFLWYLLLMSIAGIILIFVINPVFVFFRFGKIVFIPDFDYVMTIIKMTIFSSFSVSFVVFNLHVFGLYDDGSDKSEK